MFGDILLAVEAWLRRFCELLFFHFVGLLPMSLLCCRRIRAPTLGKLGSHPVNHTPLPFVTQKEAKKYMRLRRSFFLFLFFLKIFFNKLFKLLLSKIIFFSAELAKNFRAFFGTFGKLRKLLLPKTD